MLGEIHPTTAATFGIEETAVVAAEIDAEALVELSQRQATSISTHRFLPVEQDFLAAIRRRGRASRPGRGSTSRG